MHTTTSRPETTRWTLDPAHTTVGFSIRHLMITNVRGVFAQVGGTVLYDPRRPADAEVHVEIPAASIDTRVPERDAHLRSPDFFDAERHPTITFRSTRVLVGDGGVREIAGDLTIRGVTRAVTLTVTEVTGEQRDLRGAVRMGASARAQIRRSDFGIVFNKALEAGGVAIADQVDLTFDLSLLKE